MFIQRLRLRNIRGFEDFDVNLTSGGSSRAVTLVIGRNGTGKSTLLRALGLGLAQLSSANALLTELLGKYIVREGRDEGQIEVDLVDQKGETHKISRRLRPESNGASVISSDNEPFEAPFIIGFGAGRSGDGPEPGPGYSTVETLYSLFDYNGTFIQPELTIRRLRDYVGTKRYESVMKGVRQFLGLTARDQIRVVRGGGVTITGPSAARAMAPGPQSRRTIPLSAWADGYRISLNWILDIYAWAMKHGDALDRDGQVQGILLIDEIEQHLHPSMQAGVLSNLGLLFPRMQVIATTHSPLVALGAQPEDVISLHREGTKVRAYHVPNFMGYSAEDMLTSAELFETPPYSPHTTELFLEYRRLAAVSAPEAGQRKKLREIVRELSALRFALPSSDRRVLHLEERVRNLLDD